LRGLVTRWTLRFLFHAIGFGSNWSAGKTLKGHSYSPDDVLRINAFWGFVPLFEGKGAAVSPFSNRFVQFKVGPHKS
jgi:hypothetical protein